jgi:nucleoside-diphosphate-sugar epimerase
VALSAETVGKTYNMGSGVGTRFRQMVRKIADCIPNTEIREVPWPADRYFVESGDYVSDLSKIQAATGWAPEVDFGDGIEKTVSFYRENKHRYWETEIPVRRS